MKSQTFGEKIKELRQQKQYTLKQISRQINYSPSALSKVEKNEKTAPEEIVELLAKALNVPYKELMLKYLSEKIYYKIKNSDYAKEALDIVKKRIEKEGKGTQEVKAKAEIIHSLQSYFDNRPIEKAWLFGSFARNMNVSYDSDIDILVQFKNPNTITLFDIIEMKSELAKQTGRTVDLVEEGQELESIRSEIQKEKILVYAK